MFPPRKLGHQITLLAISGIVLLAVVLLTFNLFENRQRAVTAEQGALQTELQNIESVIRNASHETMLAATLIAQRPDTRSGLPSRGRGSSSFTSTFPQPPPSIGCTNPRTMAMTSLPPGWRWSR
ncbi:hypothetical protein [Aeromonas sp.]|uniref:hypothetical protein n=1 Tax=Aeromonas sp. TaxID=647 RepID=UPI0025867C51|nr:hypothetical protein [Aeromonas sp.]MCX7130252.1 hypothetical protein [Aeromonas sp.]